MVVLPWVLCNNNYMSTATRTRPSYTLGQSVQVRLHDFKAEGMPLGWVAGTVTAVEAREGGFTDLMVTSVDGRFSPQIVGKRGGNKNIRAI